MNELLEILREPWAIRALITCSLIGVMYGVLGSFIVLRNMSLIGDALSHAILPGVFIAFLVFGYSPISFFMGSVIAGLVTAVLITWIQQNIKTKNDAAIGIVFTLMFAIGVIGISWLNNAEGVHLDLKDFLIGSIMAISNQDVWLTVIVTIYTIASVIFFYRYLFITTFQPVIASTMGISTKMVHYFLMLLLSFAVVAGLKTVGVILVVALLIIPSSTALLLSNKLKRVILYSAIVGLVSAILGLIMSIFLDSPPGPAMVLIAAMLYFTAALFSPEKGLVLRMIRSTNQRKKIEREDIIRQADKHHAEDPLTLAKLQERLGLTRSKLKTHLAYLKNEGVLIGGNSISLTAKGKVQAEALVRAHRLWETYQVNTMGLSEGEIHDEADRLEHHLTDELLDEVDAKLGYPELDPHGSPIPKKMNKKLRSLISQKPNNRLLILKEQENDEVVSDLWELGLLPNTIITIKEITATKLIIKEGQKTIEIDSDLARRVLVEKW
ncbi:MAG: iron chelate uptake ABC transporter family permease subunit [Saprospiraceae bacterium]|nr:iron chelate uptake ABC transporter family permease subunit [Saprospiraceae bacterium]